MFVIYIRERINDNELYENKRLPRLITKLIQRFIKLFNIIILKKMDNNKLLIIPDINKKNVNDRLKNKLKKMGDNYYIVLSINVKKIINLNIINKKVINGKKVYKYLIESILEYILKTLELEKDTLKTLDLYIMQKEFDEEVNIFINNMVNKVRNIVVITDDINKYENWSKKNLEPNGLFILALNNKKKSLKKAKIIINFNYKKDEFIKFNINRNSIIVNMQGERIDNLLGFDGIIINNVLIKLNEEKENYFKKFNIYNEFNILELYESSIIREGYTQKLKEFINNDIKIVNLIGNNGKIDKKELLVNKKLLTNS